MNKIGFRFGRKSAGLIGIAIVPVALAILLWVKWPFTREEMTRAMETRSGRKVTTGSFEQTFFPPGLIATNVRFLRKDHPDRPAMITVKRVAVRSRWADILTWRKRIALIDFDGVDVFIPPRGSGEDGKHHTLAPLTAPDGSKAVTTESVVMRGVLLHFLPGKSGAEPFEFAIRDVGITGIRDKRAFAFDAVMENTVPKGEIHGKGTFGPWDEAEPSRTPVEGTFSFRDAQLGDIPGISGTLQSSGSFRGTLDQVGVEGTASVPNFRVVRSTHTNPLTNRFEALVNATNGDVVLKTVDSTFRHTTVHSEGRIFGKASGKGKDAELSMSVTGGRMEDLSYLFIVAKTAPLEGAISLKTSVRLPAGTDPFLRRLQMDGRFTSSGDRYTSAKRQESLNKLAASAKKQDDKDPPTVRSALSAAVQVKAGTAHIRNMVMTAPATTVKMEGTFDLLSTQVEMSGVMQTDGKLSDTETNLKAFALKVITPFLKKNKVTVAPFKIEGKFNDLTTKLDMGVKRKL